ncbi:hypothetical protein OF117_02900 [Geodermatophilus sp. YIM 151500]|uniref:hypothetical protein n=1 Tax=Geodermatophilus sp. YIM 151500 TaxID=2984531 RepID=UPI0021E39219|nr:hypothetical protein [Geodermatophilus sp. YIM 151500]MCV2488298.1 hypothetical protein [Geodermatophilus sp. YIM 151500]
MTGPTGLPVVADDADPVEVLERLLEAGHGDGLPVVPPTRARLAAMLADVEAPDLVYGRVPALGGDLTARAVAWYAVLAGCRPAELPVVVAAARSALDAGVNLLGMSTTTGAAAVGVLVHGPVAARLGMTSRGNGLGPGSRANVCVGRAVALALAGIGGATSGLTDMSTHGQPAKLTCCTAEGEDGPWPSLAARRGVSGDAVTVLGVAGTVEVLPGLGYRDAETLLAPVAAALAAVGLAAGDPRRAAQYDSVLLLPPELAGFLADRGWGPDEIARHLFDRGGAQLRAGAAELVASLASGSARSASTSSGSVRSGSASSGGGFPTDPAVLEGLAVAPSPSDLHLVVTGGVGVKMLLLPGWSGGTRSVTAPVVPL